MVKIPNWYTIANDWPDAIIKDAGINIKSSDAALVHRLAQDIMVRWREMAHQTPSPAVVFERLYKKNERNAKAAIIAILELINTVGAGKPLLPQYEDLLK